MPAADADAEPTLLLRLSKTSANPWQPCRKCGMSYVQIPREYCDDCERTERQPPRVPEILVNGKKPLLDLTAAPGQMPQHRPRLRKRVAPSGSSLHPAHARKASRSRKGAVPAPRRPSSPDAGREKPEKDRSVYELSTDGAQHEEGTRAARPAPEPEQQMEASYETEPEHEHELQREDEQETGHIHHGREGLRPNSALQPTPIQNRGPHLSPEAKEWRAKVRPLLGAAAGPSPVPSPVPSPPPTPHLPDDTTKNEVAGRTSSLRGSGRPAKSGGSFAQRVLDEVGVPTLERQRVLEQELRRARADNQWLRDLVRSMTIRAEALYRLIDLDGDNAHAALFDDADADAGGSPLLRRVYPDLCRRCRGVVHGHGLP